MRYGRREVVVPVDILSYAVGLFVPMSYSAYLAATVLGVTPFAFVFAYSMDTLPLYLFVTGVGVLAVLVYLLWVFRRR